MKLMTGELTLTESGKVFDIYSVEGLTNDWIKFLSAVKSELSFVDLTDSEKMVLIYSEFPAFGKDSFSIFVVENVQTGKLKIKRKDWDAEYDLKRFETGIYDLGRICIRLRTIELEDKKGK